MAESALQLTLHYYLLFIFGKRTNMRRFLCMLFLLPAIVHAQHTYKPEEINRLADLGRLWGILHYFHPAMADGSILTDSLVADNAASLANDPSAENFKRVVGNMLEKLKDPATKILTSTNSAPTTYNIFSAYHDSITIHRLENDVLYVACPTLSVTTQKLFERKDMSITELSKSKGIVFDFRNKNSNDNNRDGDFAEVFVSKYLGSIVSQNEIDQVFNTYIVHNGFIPQNSRFNEDYFSGWRSESCNVLYKTDFDAQKLNIPLLFIVNESNKPALLTLLRSIQFAGKALILYEGNPDSYHSWLNYKVSLTDSIQVNVKTGYQTINNNYLLLPPDKTVSKIDASEEFMKNCSELVLSINPGLQKKEQPNLLYKLPRPSNKNSLYVPVGERLFGLYNYWNAIHYFFPSRNLIGRDWDSVLYEHIPEFINATDTFSYYSALSALISEIHDSHAGVNMKGDAIAIFNKYLYKPPLLTYEIENRLFVLDIGKSTLQDLSQIRVWDEIVKIDDLPVQAHAEKYRKFISTSNDENYYHILYRYLMLSGEKNSTVKITIKRQAKMLDVLLKRTIISFYTLSDTLANLSPKYPVSNILANNIGYINMGKLYRIQVDSIMNTLWNTKAIVFDLRNYPKGTAWSLAPYLTTKPVTTHLNRMMSVRYSSINPGGDTYFAQDQHNIVLPRTDGQYYKGKVIVLCDKNSMSQSEYSVMMLAGAGKGTVIGSQTTGADGNVSDIVFPGGYYSGFSALGVYYPDGTITQRVGVKIDIKVKPTVKGLQSGRDEVLERAIRFINTGK